MDAQQITRRRSANSVGANGDSANCEGSPSLPVRDALYGVVLVERIAELGDELADEMSSPEVDMLQASVCDLLNSLEARRVAGLIPLPEDWFDKWFTA